MVLHHACLRQVCLPAFDGDHFRPVLREFYAKLPFEAGEVQDPQLIEGLACNVRGDLQGSPHSGVVLGRIHGVDAAAKMDVVRRPCAQPPDRILLYHGNFIAVQIIGCTNHISPFLSEVHASPPRSSDGIKSNTTGHERKAPSSRPSAPGC